MAATQLVAAIGAHQPHRGFGQVGHQNASRFRVERSAQCRSSTIRWRTRPPTAPPPGRPANSRPRATARPGRLARLRRAEVGDQPGPHRPARQDPLQGRRVELADQLRSLGDRRRSSALADIQAGILRHPRLGLAGAGAELGQQARLPMPASPPTSRVRGSPLASAAWRRASSWVRPTNLGLSRLMAGLSRPAARETARPGPEHRATTRAARCGSVITARHTGWTLAAPDGHSWSVGPR